MEAYRLDHVGIAVRGLDRAQATYRRLGFRLTARSAHEGRATGNHCAMLRAGYLELIGLVHPERESALGAMLARYEGGHIVAFGCDDAGAAHAAIKARYPGVEPPARLERDAPFGPEGDAIRRARFDNVYTDLPEALVLFIEHLTPEVTWQPHLLDHPNGATGLAEVAFASADVEASAGRLAALLGVPAEAKGSGIAALDLERGRIYVLAPDAVPKWAPGVSAPALPSVVGLGLHVADLDATRAWLDGQGIAYRSHPYPAVWLPPAQCHGVVLSFIQA